MLVATFTLRGTSALLMHNPAVMGPKPKGMNTKNIPAPEVEAKANCYFDKNDGKSLVFPATGVRSCILSGGKYLKIGKFSAPGVLSAALKIVEEWFWLVDQDGDRLTEYEVDIRRAVIGKAGVVRARPMLTKWWLQGIFGINTTPEQATPKAPIIYTPTAPKEAIQLGLERGGRMYGIGDYRMEKKGWFGAFEVVGDLEFKETEEEAVA